MEYLLRLIEDFFDKEYILISRRYQLYPASATKQSPKGLTDAHSQTKEEEIKKKEKSRYRVPVLVATAQPPPKQHLKSNTPKATPLRRKQCTSIVILEIIPALKTMPLTKLLYDR